jgi:protein TonB
MLYEAPSSAGSPEGSGRPGPAPPVLASPSFPALEVNLLLGIELDRTAAPPTILPGDGRSLGTARGPGGGGPGIAEFVRTAVAIADRAPSPLRVVEPVYPASMRAAGVEGSATIEFLVDSTGVPQVLGSRVIQADRPAFGMAALAAVLASRFTPGRSGGRVVPVRVRQVVRFRLK